MRLLEQPVEIAERAEDRIDVAIVRHVVAEILHRRGEERADSQMRVDAEIGDIVEPLGDADEVADAVAIVVLKRARIDLVDHRAAPPVAIENRLRGGLLLGHQRLRDHADLHGSRSGDGGTPPAGDLPKRFSWLFLAWE